MVKKVIIMFACLFALAGCSHDAMNADTEAYGMLDLSSITSSIVETRAVDTGNYIVTVWREGSDVPSGSWFAYQCNGTEKLRVGNYRLEVAAPGLQPAAWESPWYSGKADFTIYDGVTTPVGKINCTLGNIKVTVHYSDALRAKLDVDNSHTTTVSMDKGGSLTYDHGELRGGYFAATGDKMKVNFIGKVDGRKLNQSDEISVAPGDWARVYLYLDDGSTDGNGDPVVKFLITVSGSGIGQIEGGNDWF